MTDAPAASGPASDPALPGRTPLIPRPVVMLLGIVLGLGLLTAVQPIASFVAPVLLGINLVIAVAPLQAWLSRIGVPRILSALAAALALFAILAGLFWLIWWSLSSFVTVIPRYSSQFTALYDDTLAWLESIGVTQDQALEQLENVINPSALAGAATGVLSDAWAVVGFLATLVTVLFFLFYDVVAFDRRMAVIDEHSPAIGAGLRNFAGGVQRYWAVSTLFGLIVAVFNYIALVALDVPLPLVWAVFSFVTNYIPNIGFVLGVVPPTLMALLANGPVNALVIAVLFCVVNFVIQSLIQPKFAGDAVGVTPTVSFLSLLAWAYAFGPIGALLALPTTMLLKTVLVDPNPDLKWVSALISSSPRPRDPGPAADEPDAHPATDELETPDAPEPAHPEPAHPEQGVAPERGEGPATGGGTRA